MSAFFYTTFRLFVPTALYKYIQRTQIQQQPCKLIDDKTLNPNKLSGLGFVFWDHCLRFSLHNSLDLPICPSPSPPTTTGFCSSNCVASLQTRFSTKMEWICFNLGSFSCSLHSPQHSGRGSKRSQRWAWVRNEDDIEAGIALKIESTILANSSHWCQ